MALVVADRVKETTTSTGTGAISLGGAEPNFRTFSSVLSDADTTYYAIIDDSNLAFEVGLGTYASSGNTITRTTVLASSNSNNAVNFSAGTKDVFLTYPADKSVNRDASGNVSVSGGVTATSFTGNITGNVTGNVTGAVTATQVDLTGQGDLRLQDSSGGQYVALQAAATVGSSFTLTLPTADGSADEFLKTDGSGNLSFGAAGGGFTSLQIFTTSGTWTKPSGISKVKVYVTGGGGGGGGATGGYGGCGGGGAGGTAVEVIDVSSVADVTVTIGASGSGTSAGNGVAGGDSTFGSYCTGGGGSGGTGGAIFGASGGNGGSGSGGDVNFQGGRGGGGIGTSTNTYKGGMGGSSIYGGNGAGGVSIANGQGATTYGGGGGGSSGHSSSNRTGGGGQGGIVIVEEYA